MNEVTARSINTQYHYQHEEPINPQKKTEIKVEEEALPKEMITPQIKTELDIMKSKYFPKKNDVAHPIFNVYKTNIPHHFHTLYLLNKKDNIQPDLLVLEDGKIEVQHMCSSIFDDFKSFITHIKLKSLHYLIKNLCEKKLFIRNTCNLNENITNLHLNHLDLPCIFIFHLCSDKTNTINLVCSVHDNQDNNQLKLIEVNIVYDPILGRSFLGDGTLFDSFEEILMHFNLDTNYSYLNILKALEEENIAHSLANNEELKIEDSTPDSVNNTEVSGPIYSKIVKSNSLMNTSLKKERNGYNSLREKSKRVCEIVNSVFSIFKNT